MRIGRLVQLAEVLRTRRLTLRFDKLEFECRDLSARRLRNWLLAELACAVRSPRVWAWPTHLQVEPTNACNLRCLTCHTVTDGKPVGHMPTDRFQSIIDEMGDSLLFLQFWGWGEPFIFRESYAMIEYAKRKGIQIISSTDGHFFQTDADVDRLIDSGLDALIFALDGVEPESYRFFRRGGDFDRAIDGLRRLLRRRSERGADHPRVNLRMVVTRRNEDQIPRLKRLAAEVGVDVLTLKTMNSFDNPEAEATLLPRQPAFRRFRYDAAGNPIRKRNRCKKWWHHPTLYRDGAVLPCDYHTGTELAIGNAFRDGGGLRSVWFGDRFAHLRGRFARGARQGLRCADCAMNFVNVDELVSHVYTRQELA